MITKILQGNFEIDIYNINEILIPDQNVFLLTTNKGNKL